MSKDKRDKANWDAVNAAPELLIAFQSEMDMIPYERVLGVRSQDQRCPAIEVHVESVEIPWIFHNDEAKAFIEGYKTYLHYVQAITLESVSGD